MWLEDCAAECVERLWKAKEGANICTVTIRAIQDFQRRFGHWRRAGTNGRIHKERPWMDSLEVMEEWGPRMRDLLVKYTTDRVTPERIYCNKESLQEVNTLPKRERRMLLMHAMGWRYHEVGMIEGIGESRTCQLVKRARFAIAKQVAVI